MLLIRQTVLSAYDVLELNDRVDVCIFWSCMPSHTVQWLISARSVHANCICRKFWDVQSTWSTASSRDEPGLYSKLVRRRNIATIVL